jgi:hypothetical protein
MSMFLKKLSKTILTVFFFFVFLSTPTLASVELHPFTNEVTIKNTEKLTQTVTFKNNEPSTITVTLVIFSYDAQNQQMIDSKTNIFVEIKEKSFTVKPNQTVEIPYTIKPFENLNGGTYFNLIVLRTDSFSTSTKPLNVGIAPNLSHLVVMNLINEEETLKEQSTVEMEIVDNGIPFIRPMKIMYKIKNTSYYVNKPSGEIQIFNEKSSSNPIYLRVNKEEKKIYPGGEMSEEFSVSEWTWQDIFYPKEIVGRFYNGIESDYKFVNIQYKTNPIIQIITVLIPLVFIYIIIIVVKDIYSSIKKKPKN